MRFINVILLTVTLAICAGCAATSTDTTAGSSTNKKAASTATEPAVSEQAAESPAQSNAQEDVTIKVSTEIPQSLTNQNTILLDGLLEGGEYIEVIVKGEIFDFEQISVVWEESKSELVEKETVKKIEKLANQPLVIKTSLPEGIPSEKLKWKSRTGKIYEYILQYNGETGNGITKFETL